LKQTAVAQDQAKKRRARELFWRVNPYAGWSPAAADLSRR
jgi:hypothetical protein